MIKKKAKKPRPSDFHLTLIFQDQAPSPHHRPHRTFYLIDELGRSQRL